jgi:hypothetical protein
MLEPKYILVTDPEANNADESQPLSLAHTHRWLKWVLVGLVVGAASFLAVLWLRKANPSGLLHPQAILPSSNKASDGRYIDRG